MEPINQNLPGGAGNQNPPAGTSGPLNPGIPQPLNSSGQPAGDPSIPSNPLGRSAGEGLPVQPGAPHAGSSKKIIIIIIVILILGIVGVGAYYFLSGSRVEESPKVETDTKSVSDLTLLQKELENIEAADPESDLSEIDQDISLLEATPSTR